MTIEEFTKVYYPAKYELERYALEKLCHDVCGRKNVTIRNVLLRGGITSISKLYETSDEDLLKLRNVGSINLELIHKMIDRIRHNLEKGSQY